MEMRILNSIDEVAYGFTVLSEILDCCKQSLPVSSCEDKKKDLSGTASNRVRETVE